MTTTTELREDGSFSLREASGNALRELDDVGGSTWLDEFRVVKGQAVWTTGFTPPVAPYTVIPGDSTSFIGSVTAPGAISGALAVVEAPDVTSFTGVVSLPVITGYLQAVEQPDVTSFDARTPVPGGGGGAIGAGDGDGYVDYGRVRRRKARGLRQAQKFFEERKREAQEKLDVIARKAEAEAEQARQIGETSRAEAILATAREQQIRQQATVDAMLADANAKIEQARLELEHAKLLHLQARANELDEEDAISVLLLH